jgi:hypothetical protein
MMKKLVFLCMAITLATGSIAVAYEVIIPPWRGADGSTYQAWEFGTDNPVPLPDIVDNPYGEPLLNVVTPFGWDNGAWALSGEMDIYLPNRPVIDGWKELWIQVTWKPAGLDAGLSLPDQPNVAVTPFDFATFYRDDQTLPDGWIVSLYKIEMWPNPLEEWVTIKGDILVDELIIDTICIPEPMTIVLLGLGALTLLKKRRV